MQTNLKLISQTLQKGVNQIARNKIFMLEIIVLHANICIWFYIEILSYASTSLNITFDLPVKNIDISIPTCTIVVLDIIDMMAVWRFYTVCNHQIVLIWRQTSKPFSHNTCTIQIFGGHLRAMCTLYVDFPQFRLPGSKLKQEAHGPHRSPEKT